MWDPYICVAHPSMAADGLGLLQDLRGSLPGLCGRLRPRSDKTVPGLALENGRVA